MLRWVLGNFLTGEIKAEIAPQKGTWAEVLNGAAPFGATVLLDHYEDRQASRKTLDVRLYSAPWKTFLACIDTNGDNAGSVRSAGPVVGRPYDANTRAVTIQAAGMWAYWYKRVVAPTLAGRRLTDPSVTTDFWPADGLSKGTVASRLIAQALSEQYGNLPIDLPPDSPGDTERHYPGFDAAYLGDRLKQLVEVQNGPDIMWQPYMPDTNHVRWQMVVGTEADPYVHSTGEQLFDYSAPLSGASDLAVVENASRLASRAHEMGGGQTDEVLGGIATDSYLTDRGWPLMETVTNRSSVGQLSTLDGYASERVMAGRTPTELWTIRFDLNSPPQLSSYAVGDFAKLRIKSDPWVPDGDYRVRVVGLAGDEKNDKVAVTFMETEGRV